ncbi:uncharacterized protein LOC119736040 [Patiria miniata]|uniref:Tethering factor for nuclear proteasome STS1 n=1 Tax=Patiria miniata TaxID=46514 RepID=A0A914ARE2_PATMI|nr:uncharacterized protein LOC119736040 [Patiria miniata]
MAASINDIFEDEPRGVLREISIPDSAIDSRGNVEVNDAWTLGILRRRTLRPRPRVTYADLSPISRQVPSPQLPTGSFTFEPSDPEETTKNDEQDHEPSSGAFDFNFETPPKTPKSTHKSPTKRTLETPTSPGAQLPFTIHLDSPGDSPVIISLQPAEPAPAKRPRMLSLGDWASLGQQLASLTSEQLVEVVERLVEKYPDMHKEVLALLPQPDLSKCQERLSELLHNIFRALPRTRLASTRGALSYRQVKVHLLEFKKFCVQQGRHLANCQAWEALVNYVLLAWQLVNYLPLWENPAHNTIRGQCLRSLVVFCSKALKSGDLDQDRLAQLRPRFVKASRVNSMLQPCMDTLHALYEDCTV